MNSKLICAGLSLAISQSVLASQASNSGPTATTGPSSNHFSIYSATHNPAMSALTVSSDENWRMNYFLGIQNRTEVGAVDNFSDDLDELIDIIDDPSLVTGSMNETLSRFNVLLEEMGEEGYVVNTTSVIPPIFPIHFKSEMIDGTLSFELLNDTQIRLGVLDSPLSFNNQNGSIDTGTSAYLKSGIETRFSVGYARGVLSPDQITKFGGELYLGVKANIINLGLSKQVFLLTNLDGQDVDEIIEDEYENNLVKTTKLGLDVGAAWIAEKYRIGFTLKNVNQPAFDYGAIGEDCTSRPENSPSRANCEVTAAFTEARGDITKRETHKKHAVATVDANYQILKNWFVSSSIDLASYDDIVGMQNQWFTASTSFHPESMYIPGIRFGYKANLAGSELASANIGFTLLKSFHLDFEYGLDSVTVDGSTGPRVAGFGFSFEEHF